MKLGQSSEGIPENTSPYLLGQGLLAKLKEISSREVIEEQLEFGNSVDHSSQMRRTPFTS